MKICPLCGFRGEYDEMVYDDYNYIIGCMMCEGEGDNI